MSNPLDVIIQHTAFADAANRLEQYFRYAESKTEAEGVAIIGESGTGKTTLLKGFVLRHPRFETPDGMIVPVLYVSVPPRPTGKSLVEAMLDALGVPDPGRGTENEKLRRLRVLIRQTKVRVIVTDEFQHFVDQGTQKVMHHVADTLKGLIDETRCTLVISGLPYCMAVIDQNVQLARRFSAPIVMPRFRWDEPRDRKQFCAILRSFGQSISQCHRYSKYPQIHRLKNPQF